MFICIKSYYIYFFPTATTNGAKAKEIKKKFKSCLNSLRNDKQVNAEKAGNATMKYS